MFVIWCLGNMFTCVLFSYEFGDLCVSNGGFGRIICVCIRAMSGEVVVYITLGVQSVCFVYLGNVG